LLGNGYLRNVLPAILYVALIFYGGSVQVSMPLHDPPIPTDKVLHFLAFAGLSFVLFRAVRHEFPLESRPKQAMTSVALAVTCGALLELYQAALPHRSAEVLDLVADALGAGLMGLTLTKARKQRA
jgi:VanZ family protein